MNKLILQCLIAAAALIISCDQQQEQVNADEKVGRCIKGNCRNGVGTYIYPNGNKYEGEFRNNVPFGYGTMYYKNGKSIKGKWKWGRPDLR
jgi:hypothetical protein